MTARYVAEIIDNVWQKVAASFDGINYADVRLHFENRIDKRILRMLKKIKTRLILTTM